jgi:hypothetical protein
MGKYEAERTQFIASNEAFQRSTMVTAKAASIELIRRATRLAPISVAAAQPAYSELSHLLGPAFRKFCEDCERHNALGVVKRGPELAKQVASTIGSFAGRENSTTWHAVTLPTCKKIQSLVEGALADSAIATSPALSLANDHFKLNLTQVGVELTFSSRLRNSGNGLATDVRCKFEPNPSVMEFRIISPRDEFDVPADSEVPVTLSVTLRQQAQSLQLAVIWGCKTLVGKAHQVTQTLDIGQQQSAPNWQELLNHPPYSLNPVRSRDRLYGRDAVLKQLALSAAAHNSVFIWGQKRVGKTSVLQVLSEDLRTMPHMVCCFFRMGEVKTLHEGQLGHRIASRLLAELGEDTAAVELDEKDFGAGIAGLIPFLERLTRRLPEHRFVIVIDEFDDIDPAFYTGQRGDAFVKSLRSLSEMGLSFFLVGSERMKTIYARHSMELNKWIDVHLDRIEARADCRALITQPVANAIEYESKAVDLVVDYCDGNPFYMQLLCSEIFQHCLQENRTYVSEGEVHDSKRTLLNTLGETSFAHLWKDNPVLEPQEQVRCAGENSLILACLARLGGSSDADDVPNAQNQLTLDSTERVSSHAIRSVIERLNQRGVLTLDRATRQLGVKIPIFRDWLIERGELVLLPIWRQYLASIAQGESVGTLVTPVSAWTDMFPISEEQLFEVAQKLIYCGKQKDVSELRIWLRQFDDDVRIEIAFALLRQMAEHGYISEGARLHNLGTIDEAILRKRQTVGSKVWKEIRGRYDNLCITYVDSEIKSGATTTRELAKRRRPGKYGPATDIDDWIVAHRDQDPILVLVDDFAGTGETISKGLRKLIARPRIAAELDSLLREGRLALYLLFAFPEAVDRLRKEFAGLDVTAATVFDDQVRALSEHSGVFDSKDEIEFAAEVLLQYGRALYGQSPLGFGDLGALIVFHSSVPNNTLPIFWSNGAVNGRPWKPLFPRA